MDDSEKPIKVREPLFRKMHSPPNIQPHTFNAYNFRGFLDLLEDHPVFPWDSYAPNDGSLVVGSYTEQMDIVHEHGERVI